MKARLSRSDWMVAERHASERDRAQAEKRAFLFDCRV